MRVESWTRLLIMMITMGVATIGLVEGKSDGSENLPKIAYENRTIYPPLMGYPPGFSEGRGRKKYARSILPLRSSETGRGIPHMCFGLLSDVQYAEVDVNKRRHFKMSKDKLQHAVRTMNANWTHLDFVIHLGDLVDHNMDRYLPILQPILDELEYPFFQVLGNHDFLGLPENALKSVHTKLGMPSRYYSMIAGGGEENGNENGEEDEKARSSSSNSAGKNKYRLVVLDGNDLSFYSTLTGSPERKIAESIFWDLKKKKAKNANKFNGALGGNQLNWMKTQFAEACALGQRVIVFIHHPMRPRGEPTNLWNDMVVVPVVTSYRCVVAVINGHAHKFLYDYHHVEKVSESIPGHKVHFVTFGGIVQSPFTSFGFADLYDDHMHVHGLIFGRAIDYRYNLDPHWKRHRRSNGEDSRSEVVPFATIPPEKLQTLGDNWGGSPPGIADQEVVVESAISLRRANSFDVYGNSIPISARRPFIISAPASKSSTGGAGQGAPGGVGVAPPQYRLRNGGKKQQRTDVEEKENTPADDSPDVAEETKPQKKRMTLGSPSSKKQKWVSKAPNRDPVPSPAPEVSPDPDDNDKPVVPAPTTSPGQTWLMALGAVAVLAAATLFILRQKGNGMFGDDASGMLPGGGRRGGGGSQRRWVFVAFPLAVCLLLLFLSTSAM